MEKLKQFFRRLGSKDILVEHGQIELVDETEADIKKHKNRYRLAILTVVLLILTITSWISAGFYMPKIKIANELVPARVSNESLKEHIKKLAGDYKVTIAYPDGTKKDYTLKEAGIEADLDATVRDIRSRQKQFNSRLYWWRPTTAYLSINNNPKLEEFIAQKATVTIQPPTDAKLSLNKGNVELSGSVDGQHYGLNEPVATLLENASRLRTQPLQLQTLSTRPAISSRQLEPYQARLKKMLGQKVVFIINDRSVQASPADISEWIELTSAESGKTVDITVNSGKVLNYINKIAKASVRPPKAQIEVKRPDGSSSVLIKGINGTDVINKENAASQVADDLLNEKSIEKPLDIKFAAFTSISAQAYPKWIEVDTTNKRMYAYEEDRLIRTFLISAGAPATPTPVGQFAIRSKVVQQDMRGFNVDGSRYFQPNVSWVNYFYSDYAIHGNYWRPLSYFGNVNSSHGCVGIVNSDAQWIYSWAPIGTTVIVHR